MDNFCQLRVLIIDDDPAYRSTLSKALYESGFDVSSAEGSNDDLIKSASQLASLHRPHVVVMDLRLFENNKDTMTGLDLWLFPIFTSSNTRCILNSAYIQDDYRITRDALLQYQVDDVVSKGDPPQRLIHSIEISGRKGCACRDKVFTIHWPAAWNEDRVISTLFAIETEIPPSTLVRDVIGRLFPEVRTLHLQNLGGEARSPSSIIRGRYVLLQAQPDDRQSAVIKLAPAKHTHKEVKAYKEYIKDRLEGGFHAQLNVSQIFWDLGGINYSLIGSSDPNIHLFRDHYRQAKTAEAVVRPLRHFFQTVWSKHYLNRSPLDQSLYDAYDGFFRLDEKLKDIRDNPDSFSMPGVPIKFPNPVRWVLHHKQDSYLPLTMKAVTHGDLHGDNMFTDAEHAWAIDFERSGPGPVLRDFVELEEDIVIRLASLPEEKPDLFLRLVVDLLAQKIPGESIDPNIGFSAGQANADKARQVVFSLRKLALETTGFLDMREYYWGLLFDALFGGILAGKDSLSFYRNMLMASMLCVRLRDWGRPWPPADWKLTQQLKSSRSTQSLK